jgi:hypothetical protein
VRVFLLRAKHLFVEAIDRRRHRRLTIDTGGEVYQTTAYGNAGGMGDRTSIITVTTDAVITAGSGPVANLVNGTKGNNNLTSCWVNGGHTNRRFTCGFSYRVLITEAKWF